uniref:ATP synthase complex subunit 8 n=1 Tax=Himacerus apterus TaxID=347976 RepID=K7NBA9_9HEMI|nr:ATP synthase F0 subunit 8 [Himacerus apterus]
MPQMAPMWWSLLFIMFIMIMIMIIMINYFNLMYKIMFKPNSIHYKMNKNWKW